MTPRQAGVIILRLAVWSAPSAIIVAVFATDVPWGWWGFFVLLAFFGQMALAAFFWFLEARIKGPPLTPEAFPTWREMKKKDCKKLIELMVGIAATIILFRIAEALFFG